MSSLIGPELVKPAVFSRARLIRFSDSDPAGVVFYPQYFVMFNGLVEDWFNEVMSPEGPRWLKR